MKKLKVSARLSRWGQALYYPRDLHQLPLFEWQRRIKRQQIYSAIDRVRGRFGLESLTTLTAHSAHLARDAEREALPAYGGRESTPAA